MRSIVVLLVLVVSCNTQPKQFHTIIIEQMQFKPASLTVQKGDEVTFINRDMVVHNVKELAGKTWVDSIQTGGTFSMTVTKSADYFCSLHPVMKGRIEVQ